MVENDSLVLRAAKLISQQEQAKRLIPMLNDIIISEDNQNFERLDEGRWINGRFDNNIRIDQPTCGAGKQHAHVYGRKGNELGVVNIDGTASHGTQCRLPDADADALRARGFVIPPGNIVEWTKLIQQPQLLLG